MKCYSKMLLIMSTLCLGLVPSVAESNINASVGEYPSVSWNTEILPENVIWKSGFELDDVRPGLVWGEDAWDGEPLFDKYGSQSFSNESSYSGNYSLKLGNTLRGYNQKWVPITGDKGGVSFCFFEENIYGIENGTKLSVTYKAKSKNGTSYAFLPTILGNNVLEHRWKASYENKLTPIVKNGKDIVVEDNFILNGVGTWVKLNDVSWLNSLDDGMVDEVIFIDFSGSQTFYKSNMVRILYVNKSSNTVYLQPSGNDIYNVKAGTQVQERRVATVSDIGPAELDGGGAVLKEDSNFKYNNNTEWELFSYNGVIFDEDQCFYNTSKDGVYLSIKEVSKGEAFLDDLVIGYATKIKLYRNSTCIYEGYGNSFEDKVAKDVLGPSMVSDIKTTVIRDLKDGTSALNITYKEPTDVGSEYSYKISTVNKFGTESVLNNYKAVVMSGIKGYSYVIDKNSETIPDNVINTASNSITAKIDDKKGEKYYLHIKAIDKSGNPGAVVHKKIDIPTLKVEGKNLENMVRLDWSMGDIKDKTFKVYQKKPGSDNFQSISSTNFEDSKQVTVLNIHPNVGDKITFTTWDGETLTLPKSASLKQWMEEPNSESPKGYGKGIIEVVPVTQEKFNENPELYLKDSQGNWKVNVVMVGTWDDNYRQTFNELGLNWIKRFIEEGNGYLTGHDTSIGLNLELFPYLNLRAPGDEGIPVSYRDNLYRVGDNKIINNKKGLLTTFPWNIQNKILNIPKTHTSYQWAFGDIWFDFEGVQNDVFPSYGSKEIFSTDGKGTNNFYLTTWNNTAMIQTGHTNGQATSDEQKILANTLFYLNQLNDNNFLDDFSGQDIKAPEKPTINLLKSSSDSLKFNFDRTKDSGSEYSYYVSAQSKDGGEVLESSIVSTTVTSGLKGYSYILDQDPSTIPSNNVNHISGDLTISNIKSDSTYYLHIKAIDKAGNVGEVNHYKINTNKPLSPNLNLSREGWGTDNVSFNITQKHNKDVKIISISGSERQRFVSSLKRLGYDIVQKNDFNDYNEIMKYDLVLFDADSWGVYNNDLLKKLFDSGAKIISIGNDSSESLYPIKSTNHVWNIKLDVTRSIKNEATFNMPTYKGMNDSNMFIITSIVEEAYVWYRHNYDNSPAIIEIQNNNGGKWIHSQMVMGVSEAENSDELCMGLVDHITEYISQVHVSDVQYKINNGSWTSYNGGDIPITQEGLHTVSIRNIDNRGILSDTVTKTVGIDRTSPYFIAIAPDTTQSRSINVALSGMGDSLSGIKNVRISNYPDFRDVTGYTQVTGKTSIDIPIIMPFFSDAAQNYSVRTIYIELFDNVGNSKVLTCITKHEPKPPETPVITSPKNNKLYVTGEKVDVSWIYEDLNNDGIKIPQGKAIITFTNNTTKRAYSYTVNGSDKNFKASSLSDGVYSVIVTVYNTLGETSTSSPVTFRYNVHASEGYVLSKAIKLGTPVKYLNVISSVDIPIETTVSGYIYYAPQITDTFNENRKVKFSANRDLIEGNIIRLPEKSAKIMIKWNLNSSSSNKSFTPAIDDIIIFGR